MDFTIMTAFGGQLLEQSSSVVMLIAVILASTLVYNIKKYSRNRARLHHEWQMRDMARNAPALGGKQLFDVSPLVSLKPKPVFDKKTLKVLGLLEAAVWDVNSSFSVLLRCRLDRALSLSDTAGNASERETTLRSLKSQTLDYLVVNDQGLPVMAVIYRADGPSANSRAPGDPVIELMSSVLQQAGIRFLDINPGYSARSLTKRIKRSLKSEVL